MRKHIQRFFEGTDDTLDQLHKFIGDIDEIKGDIESCFQNLRDVSDSFEMILGWMKINNSKNLVPSATFIKQEDMTFDSYYYTSNYQSFRLTFKRNVEKYIRSNGTMTTHAAQYYSNTKEINGLSEMILNLSDGLSKLENNYPDEYSFNYNILYDCITVNIWTK